MIVGPVDAGKPLGRSRRMHNLIGSCLVLVLLGGGFALTGDVGRLVAGFRRVITATDVPDEDAPVPVVSAAASRAAPLPDAAPPRPPHRGPDTVDVATLAPGTRITAWLGQAGVSTSGPARRITLDIVDPGAREALVSDVHTPMPGVPMVAPAPPRRALLRGSGPDGLIVRGGMVEIESRGIAGAAVRETMGPVVALEVLR